MAPTILSRASWILGRGYESFLVRALSHLKSTQKRRVLSFFLTNTTALHQGDWLEHMAPSSSISLKEAWTSSKSGGGILLNLSLKGSLSTMQISCSTVLVQPNSFFSSAKMLWYDNTNCSAASVFLGAQFFRPLKSSFSRSFACCSTMERGSAMASKAVASSDSNAGTLGGTGIAGTKRATRTPFLR